MTSNTGGNVKKNKLNTNPKRHIEKIIHAMPPRKLYEYMFRTACEWAIDGDRDAAQWVIDELLALDREHNRREYETLRGNTDLRNNIVGKPCVMCGNPSDTVDHIIPLSRNGTNIQDNLQPMCWDCNRKKGNR